MKKDKLSLWLASGGIVLVWLPILTPIFFTLVAFLQQRFFRFDFLMPAELFPLVLLGGILLLWVALRTKRQRGLIGWSFTAAIILPVAGQGLAVVTGLASGETAPGSWQSTVVITFIAMYILAVICMGIGGILLFRGLIKY